MTVYVITHKPFDYDFPDGYVPLLVGADFNANPLNYLQDNTGNNISSLNKSFCELTGLYWMWKNAPETENIGLVHYRRYFGKHDFGGKKAALWHLKNILFHHATIANTNYLNSLLETADVIVSHPDILDEETIRGNYVKHHYAKDLDITRQVLVSQQPAYAAAFDRVMAGDRISLYNMFYMSRKLMDKYCNWLFPILFQIQKRVDISNYDTYQQRVFGFLAERLFNVWLEQNQQLKIKYLTVFNTQNFEKGRFAQYYKDRIAFHINNLRN